uniref:CAAX prenyl protease 2/Lysostaphin resistance protein A-like domain-containing protein n=1 Tax=Alexandrium monilatum TaxID=311494 RepID=A0A7S4UTS5_9DINO
MFTFEPHAVPDTISDLIFPAATGKADLYMGPRCLHRVLMYLTLWCPERDSTFGLWAVWCATSIVVLASSMWKEVLFRGIYLGGLRTHMPFWAANAIGALIYALAHEPLMLSSDGALKLEMVGLAPVLVGGLWYGYLYHKCGNLLVNVIAQLLFNLGLLGLHLAVRLAKPF